jgi:hypothetical protein
MVSTDEACQSNGFRGTLWPKQAHIAPLCATQHGASESVVDRVGRGAGGRCDLRREVQIDGEGDRLVRGEVVLRVAEDHDHVAAEGAGGHGLGSLSAPLGTKEWWP